MSLFHIIPVTLPNTYTLQLLSDIAPYISLIMRYNILAQVIALAGKKNRPQQIGLNLQCRPVLIQLQHVSQPGTNLKPPSNVCLEVPRLSLD